MPKTYKLFIGGAFPRSESGRVLPALAADGATWLANYSHASRKDFRDAVVKARAGAEKWSATSAYLRGQMLYRAAELLEARRAELESEIARATQAGTNEVQKEVDAAIDLLVYYAGWTDKFAQITASVNPVAPRHFNFTFPEPTGIVAVFSPDLPPLLGLLSLVVPALVGGNSVVAIASDLAPLPALALGEILATSDFPPGTVNILAGRRAELASTVADHMEVASIVCDTDDTTLAKTLQLGTSKNLKRVTLRSTRPNSPELESPYAILDTTDLKTVWHPMSTQ